MNLFISWNFDPEIVHLPMLAPRWYGLMFAMAFYMGYVILRKIWFKEKLDEASLDKLSWYVILATLIGARLGHVLFYGPWFNEVDAAGNVLVEGYFSNPLSILNIREGGLASHGATIGILVALWLYLKFSKIGKSFLWLVDRLVIVVALGAAFVRIGNFANSEIIGTPTNAPTAVVFLHNASSKLDAYVADKETALSSYTFESTNDTQVYQGHLYQKYNLVLNYAGSAEELEQFVLYGLNYVFNTKDLAYRHTFIDNFQELNIQENANGEHTVQLSFLGLPRHPAQLYEAFCYLLLFLVLFVLYRKYGTEIRPGLLFGVFLTFLFTARFFVEFVKENQADFEEGLALNMGQNLSIPFVLLGLGFIIYSLRKPKAL